MWGIRIVFVCLSFLINIEANAYQNLNSVLNDPVFDLETFIGTLNNSQEGHTLESTLLELKKEKPSFFQNYVLMYKSRSLQTSSFLYPRVLLSSPNATTIISYNGHPSDNGYEKLEVMRFDTQNFRFMFNEISFADGQIFLSENNPKKCMNCHQSSRRKTDDPRPNWEPYSIWPGAYSSTSVGPKELSDPQSPKYDLVLAQDASLENEMYQLFLDTISPSHPRYSLLTVMMKSERGEYFPAIGTPKDAANGFTTTLTDLLLNLNALRIARLIKESPISMDYKKVVLALAKCEKIYLPPQIFVWHKEKSHPQTLEDVKLEKFAEAIEFIFEPYQISTQDWSMDFGTGGKFAFRHRFGGPNLFRRTLQSALETVMPELEGSTCQDLEREIKNDDFSLTQALREKIEKTWEPENTRPLIQRCISCHLTSDFGAPYIPFDNKNQLSQYLKRQGYPRGRLKDEILYRIGPHALFFERMPADGYLPQASEIQELIDYINSL